MDPHKANKHCYLFLQSTSCSNWNSKAKAHKFTKGTSSTEAMGCIARPKCQQLKGALCRWNGGYSVGMPQFRRDLHFVPTNQWRWGWKAQQYLTIQIHVTWTFEKHLKGGVSINCDYYGCCIIAEHIYIPVRLQLRWHLYRQFGLYGSIKGDRAFSTPATWKDHMEQGIGWWSPSDVTE